MRIKKKDLVALCKHIYLCGHNSNKPLDSFEDNYDEWEKDRNEIIEEFIRDYKENGYMCYGDECGSKKHPEHKAEAVGDKAIVDRGFVGEGI